MIDPALSSTYLQNLYPSSCNISAMSPRKKPAADKPLTITLEGYEVVEKVAKPCSTSARILVPRHWVGKRVRAIRLDP